MKDSAPVLQLDAVSKSFGLVQAEDGVSVSVRPGEIVALLGGNGAGKTTILRMVIGMLHPDRGTVRYRLGGRDLSRPDTLRIGYLPEDRGVYQDVPVQRALLYFAALRGMSRADARREAGRWLERLGLGDRASEELRNLSKGNQQKVQFISSIIHRPELAVLDEPFSGLDPLNQDFFLELIAELREAGTAVILSAHQMQLVERLADRVVLIQNGRAASEGSVSELRSRWGAGRRLRVRLGEPVEVGFLDQVPGVQRHGWLGDGLLEVLLEPEVSMSHVLEPLAQRLDVRELETESLTLHDIYIRTLGTKSGNGEGEVGR